MLLGKLERPGTKRKEPALQMSPLRVKLLCSKIVSDLLSFALRSHARECYPSGECDFVEIWGLIASSCPGT